MVTEFLVAAFDRRNNFQISNVTNVNWFDLAVRCRVFQTMLELAFTVCSVVQGAY